jgi:peptidoglycan-N-acetylglucosamine deacetylase
VIAARLVAGAAATWIGYALIPHLFTPLVTSRGCQEGRSVALTFDDGPGPQTAAILDALAAGHAHATFFTLGGRMTGHDALLRRIVANGSEIGDHTWSHADLARLGRAGQRAEIRSQAFLTERGGLPRPHLLRPPYGSYDRLTRSIATRERMLIVLWSDDPQDYEMTSVRALRRAVLQAAQPGAIVLLHDGPGPRETTSRALPGIIRALHRRGYRLVTVSELVAGSRPPARQGLRTRPG